MIIISQDEDMIFNFNNVAFIGIENPLNTCSGKFAIQVETINDTQCWIGEYETEERAKEVLLEIKGNCEMRKELAYYMPKE